MKSFKAFDDRLCSYGTVLGYPVNISSTWCCFVFSKIIYTIRFAAHSYLRIVFKSQTFSVIARESTNYPSRAGVRGGQGGRKLILVSSSHPTPKKYDIGVFHSDLGYFVGSWAIFSVIPIQNQPKPPSPIFRRRRVCNHLIENLKLLSSEILRAYH